MTHREYTEKQAESRREIGKIELPVRFFAYGIIDGEIDLVELTESEWLEIDAPIAYERHTVFANGCAQVCLTKENV